MERRVACVLLLACLAGCTGPAERTFAVKFPAFSADLDPSAGATVREAASYAKANGLAPLSVDGYHARPAPGEPDTIQQERVQVVTHALEAEGIEGWRIQVLGTGLVYPQGVPMPSLPERQVVIKIGL